MTGLGVLNPAGALLALAAVAALILLHLYAGRRRLVPVATLFLWRRVPAQVLERRRFRPSPLFLLQLALLLALAAGYLRPYLAGPARPPPAGALLLVLDVSASMQTREPGGSRFELARRRAERELAALAGDGEVMVLAAAERPRVVLPWTADHARARARLEALEPLDTPTRLGAALELALGEAAARPGARALVLTDLPPEESGVGPDALAAVHWIQLGGPAENLAVAGLTVDEPPFHGPAAATTTVLVRNYGRTARRVALEARVGGALWNRRELVLGPRSSEHVLLRDPPRAGVVEAVLTAGDALAADDRALGWIAPGAPLDLLLVSDSRELGGAFADLIAAIAGGRVEVTSPARYRRRLPAGRRVAVFDGFVPEETPPAVNALYVAPPRGNPLCPSAGFLEEAAVVDWTDHPALAGLEDLQALAVERASQLRAPDWGAPVVLAAGHGVTFPLLVAGERGGRRVACLGADLAGPLASADRLPLLMLTLGTLRWLMEPYGGRALVVETGSAAPAGPGPRAPVHGPGGGEGLRVGGDPPVVLAERAGVYRLGPADGGRLVLANLFDDRESDVARGGPRERPPGGPRERPPAGPRERPPAGPRERPPAGTAERRDLGWWLYLAAAGLLALEWGAWRRGTRP